MSSEPEDLPPDDAAEDATGFDAIVAERRAKAERLADAGVDPHPVRYDTTHTLAEVHDRWGDLGPGDETGERVRVAGRLVAQRDLGKLAFGVLRADGTDLQLFCQVDVLGDEGMDRLRDLDVGDWVGAEGEVIVTRRGELSVRPSQLTLVGKGLRPLPEKWHGLKDVEQRYRQREVDLTVNEGSRRAFVIRTQVVRALRAELEERGYLEVETPMLHPIPGGATARPFATHHNALDVDLYLRIAPELYLKRLVAGGFTRVFEIGRVFRNEGISPRHNPEFTMLECYQAFGDLSDMMDLTEALVQRCARESIGTLELTYQGRELSLGGPWPRRTVLELTSEATGRELDYDMPLDELRALCDEHGVAVERSWGAGKLVVELYEKLVETALWEPVFVTEHPLETSPLARPHRSKPHVVERFEPLVVGRELGNAFSELVDPDDQRARFEAQAEAKAAGDEEAMVVDEAYLAAMELGMPPMGGLGIGVDRLTMLLADVPSIRDVVLFPTLRPLADEEHPARPER